MSILRSTNTNLGQQTLHELGVPVDDVDKDGNTAAMIASAKGNIEIVKLLHDMKADLTLCGQSGHTKILEVTFYEY